MSCRLGLAQGFATYNGGKSIERRGDRTIDCFLEWLIDKGREAFERHDRILRGLYRGEIEFMDQQLGRATGSLKQRGLYDKSAIVFLSDHAENFGEPDPRMAFRHGMLHQHVERLPLVVKLPGSRWAGDRRDFLVANIGIAPTVVELLGLAGGGARLGHSLLPAIASEQLARISREFLATARQEPRAVLDTEDHINALRELGYIE